MSRPSQISNDPQQQQQKSGTSITGYNVRSRGASLLSSGAKYLASKDWSGSASGSGSGSGGEDNGSNRSKESEPLGVDSLNSSSKFNSVPRRKQSNQTVPSTSIATSSSTTSCDSIESELSYTPYRATRSKRQSSIDLLKKPIRSLHTSSSQNLQSSNPNSSFFSSSSSASTSSSNSQLIHPVLLPGYCLSKVARDRVPQGWGSIDPPENLEDGEVELEILIQGFVGREVERGAESRTQRLFQQMGRRVSIKFKDFRQDGRVL